MTLKLKNNSKLTAPSSEFPAYVITPLTAAPPVAVSNSLTVYPATITGTLTLQYIRYPLDPKWTFSSVPGATGEPLFDSTAVDYQDFELPSSDEPSLVLRILEYAGLSIRELAIYEAASKEDMEENAAEK